MADPLSDAIRNKPPEKAARALPPNPVEDLRKLAMQFLDTRLGQAEPKHGALNRPMMNAITLSNPERFNPEHLVDDPQGEFAVQYLRARHPQLFAGMSNAIVGATDLGRNTLGLTSNEHHVALAPSKGDQLTVLDTLRHELSHVAGLEDSGNTLFYRRARIGGPAVVQDGNPSAYAVSGASDWLHKDIPLRPERAKP